ncbi:MAG: hypothetical protein KC731_33095, partial [Myxococcales bacterium]|nr:hypothetical protein [Myxococcales bacterium]
MAALTSRGNVYFWGYDMSGQFAHPDTYGSAVHVPIRSPSMHCIVEVSMADNYACVRDAWGEVACHGGTPPGIDQGIVPAFGEARALSMGYLAGVATDGQALFAGIWNYDGDNNLVVQSPPGWPHGPEPRFATLPTSGGPACGIDPHAAAWCFGFNDYGQIGDGTLEDAAQPQPVLGLGPVKQLAVERDRRCARTIDNRLACWGRGPLGDGSTPNDYSSTAVFLDTLVDVQDVAM